MACHTNRGIYDIVGAAALKLRSRFIVRREVLIVCVYKIIEGDEEGDEEEDEAEDVGTHQST